jgi:hypothetical protein
MLRGGAGPGLLRPGRAAPGDGDGECGSATDDLTTSRSAFTLNRSPRNQCSSCKQGKSLRMPELIHLGGKVFSSKSKAEAFVRSINDAHVPGEFLTGKEDAAIRAALQRHPGCAEKVGLGIRRIGIFGNGDTRSGHGFGVERVDGTIARFSYRNCFDANRRENRDRVSEAFRQAVRSAVLKWRDNTVTKHEGRMLCPIARTPIDPKRCHVDHTSPSFAELVKEFLSTEGLEIDEVGVERLCCTNRVRGGIHLVNPAW